MKAVSCNGCQEGKAFTTPITMAFQPIVNVLTGDVFAYEALVRGVAGQGAGEILAQVSEDNVYGFDQQCRVKAIELASGLSLEQTNSHLSINFLPNAIYEPRACIRATLAAAMRTGFPVSRIIFEFTEVERLDTNHILNILRTYKTMGFKTAIDDFGAGYAGLGLLSKFQPDVVKLDMELIREIDKRPASLAIVRNCLKMMEDLQIKVICEGIETIGEYETLRELGVELMQGYLFAKPAIEALPLPHVPGEQPPLARVK